MAKLTMLSFGGGQDSTAILYKIVFDPIFRRTYASGDLVVVMSDTGDEHKETYEHVEFVKKFCEEHGVTFIHLQPDMGYHGRTWQSLRGQYELNNTVGSKAFPKSCTDKLKIYPIYNFLSDYVNDKYLFGESTPYRKKSLYEFVDRYDKIDVLLGIASGEEKRINKSDPSKLAKWMTVCLNKVYPLVDLEMDRQACQDYIESVGMKVPPPSNCILCPFMSEIELLWMWRFIPEDFNQWVIYEQNKINRDPEKENNLGVWGKRMLPEVLERAKEKYGHMSDDELQEYKMSHGHCVMSSY